MILTPGLEQVICELRELGARDVLKSKLIEGGYHQNGSTMIKTFDDFIVKYRYSGRLHYEGRPVDFYDLNQIKRR